MNSVWTDRYPSEFGWSLYGPEQTQNAHEIYHILVDDNGVNSASAYAILGNLTTESFLNPGQWQYHENYDVQKGFGLGQWDPSTKVNDYLTAIGVPDTQENMENAQYQIDYLLGNSGQWSLHYVDPNTGYSSYYDITIPVYNSLSDFLYDTGTDVEAKTKAWMACWERPNNTHAHLDSRIAYAQHWAGSPSITLPLIIILAKVANARRLLK